MLLVERIPWTEPKELFMNAWKKPYFFFLDSCKYFWGLGRWSFIGWAPSLILKAKGKKVWLMNEEGTQVYFIHPFEALRSILKRYKRERMKTPPFSGGAIGYIGYDICKELEDIPLNAMDDLALPDMLFCFYDTFVAFDNIKKNAYIIATKDFGRKPRKNIQEFLCTSNEEHIEWRKKDLYISSNFTKQEYIDAILKAKSYIREGEIYQVNLSQRLTLPLPSPVHLLYLKLREKNPAPFAAYMNCNDFQILCLSPERFLKVQKRKVMTCPIKGTRPRGKTKDEDERLKKALLESKKDEAELIMIVDLLRNDLGRVCEWGKVKVKHLRRIQKHPSVFHTVATICGTLKKEADIVDLLYATFPGGSITGAPKIRAMQIIDELEPHRRNIYTGSLGYIGFDGYADLNIVIRTFIVKDGTLYLHVGGGIVADSVPENEWEETLHKGATLLSAALGEEFLNEVFYGKLLEERKERLSLPC